jgi:hypothetical protein
MDGQVKANEMDEACNSIGQAGPTKCINNFDRKPKVN